MQNFLNILGTTNLDFGKQAETKCGATPEGLGKPHRKRQSKR